MSEFERSNADNVTTTPRVDRIRVVENARQASQSGGRDHKLNSRDIPTLPDYDLIHPIGVGGFGTVWLGLNQHDQRFYAIKIIDRDAEVELNGVRELKRLASTNPYLVPIGHVGKTGESFYYVMPLADDATGPGAIEYEPMTLRKHIEQSGRLAASEALQIVTEILQGLEKLHASGSVHHDVKPSNVLRFDGRWKLADSGLISSDDDELVGGRGTPEYSPAEGESDASADIYATGKTLFRMLAGFGESRFDEFVAGKVGGCDAIVCDLVSHACCVESRFDGASEMLDAIQRVSIAQGVSRGRDFWVQALVLTAAMLFAASALAWFAFNRGETIGNAPVVTGPIDAMTDSPKLRTFEVTRMIQAEDGSWNDIVLGETVFDAQVSEPILVKLETTQQCFVLVLARDTEGEVQSTAFEADGGPIHFPSKDWYGLSSESGTQTLLGVVFDREISRKSRNLIENAVRRFQPRTIPKKSLLVYRDGAASLKTSTARASRIESKETESMKLEKLCTTIEAIDGVIAVEACSFGVLD